MMRFHPVESLNESDAGAWLDAYANSTCSCNSVMYNLLSACELCQNRSPVLFSNWTSECNSNDIGITDYYPIPNPSVDIPAWASVKLATDNFNAQRAMSAASDAWSPLQIVLPIVTGVGVFLVCVALFLWYRSCHRNPYNRAHKDTGFLSRFRRTASPVVHERLQSWVVDLEPPEHPSRLSSYSTDSSVGGIDHKQVITKAISPFSFHSKIFPSKAPVPLNSLPRRQGFRIDDTDLSTKAASRSSTMVIARTLQSHEDEQDERSVLLISRNPGVDFTIESTAAQSPGTDRTERDGDVGVDVESASPAVSDPPGSRSHLDLPNPHSPTTTPEYPTISRTPSPSLGHSYTYISLPRMNRADPSNLIPTPVRAAGYDPFRASVSSLGSHSRNPSADSLYWNGNPSIGDPVLPPGDLSPVATRGHS
ncbi:hypothetical protein NEOLEDRAFT_640813 [Neolentinus lepideus HHB14362 ss-1]|uniref:Transmembrane protein n=1 Tax=Neolentinus lepideus HHB14362 ss-1 TaxID=1314782 RepID=A0A165QKU2_9AGAM|nr:hypothetical protein NEOLEDRAFT_640813 [Neolentinus lepideus HHB14362 ss-1]